MPWDTTRPPDAKYRTKQHRELRARYVRQIQAGHALACTAAVCLLDRAPITNPNGRDPDGLHLGHQDNGVDYAGPQHNVCNVRDGAVRGRATQRGREPERRLWDLGSAPEPWLDRDYHPCPACGATVTWARQRCCSKDCAVRQRRADATPKPVTEQQCSLCGASFTGRKRKYCNAECMSEANARQARDRYRKANGMAVDRGEPTNPQPRSGRSWAL